MQQIVIQNIQLSLIQPSPYQPRQHFDLQRLEDLAQNIQIYGLIHSVLVRPKNGHYELIVGERRVRAVKLLEWETIRAEVRNVSDAIARGIVLSENLKRDDLTAIEQILADALWIDNELRQDLAYQELQIPEKVRTQWTDHVTTLSHDHQDAIVRLNYLLMKLYSDEKNKTNYLRDKFVPKVEAAFQSLIEPIEWQSFYQHDLTSYLKMDERVNIELRIQQNLMKNFFYYHQPGL